MSINTAVILDRVDLLALVERDLGRGKKSGRAVFFHCPFHIGDHTPSLAVYPDRHYHCYGCGAHGTAIDYVMQRDGIEFVEACDRLGDPDARIIASEARPIYTPKPSRFTTRQYTADAHPARYQMWKRYKRVPPEIVDKYRLGYGREYGRDWLQIPIYRCIDSDGNELPKFDKHALQCIGVRLRSVPPAKKWMSMRDTPAGDLLYPHPQIVGEGDVLWIAENMIDALLLMKMWPGTPALALCAGAGPGKWHHEFSTQIARRRPSGVVLALDNDDPGRAMTAEAVESLALAGIPAMPYGWGEQGAEEGDDVGSFLLTRAAGV